MTSMIGRTGGGLGGALGGGPTGKNIIPKGYKYGRIGQYTPQQQQLFGSLFKHLGPQSFLSKLAGGDEGTFEQLEAPALRQFGELQGGLASRFSGMGSAGARKSSGFQNVTNQAASDLAQQLQAQRQGLQRQAIGDLFGLGESLLGQRPYEQFLTPKQPSFLQSLLSSAVSGLGTAAGAFGGGLGGLAAGKKFGIF